MSDNEESLLSVSSSSVEQVDELNVVKEGEEENRERKVPEDCGTVTTKLTSDRKKMPDNDENLPSASSLSSPSASSLSWEQTAEHSLVKEGEEASSEGNLFKPTEDRCVETEYLIGMLNSKMSLSFVVRTSDGTECQLWRQVEVVNFRCRHKLEFSRVIHQIPVR